MRKINCLWCGKERENSNGRTVYCDWRCRRDFNKAMVQANEMQLGFVKENKCRVCGKIFLYPKGMEKGGCSDKCSSYMQYRKAHDAPKMPFKARFDRSVCMRNNTQCAKYSRCSDGLFTNKPWKCEDGNDYYEAEEKTYMLYASRTVECRINVPR